MRVLQVDSGRECAAADGTTVHGTAWELALDPRAWWQLRRTISAFQPDIIHAHDSHGLTLAATLARSRTLIAARRVDFHVGRFGGWRRADRIIAVSDAAKQVLVGDGIAGDRITVVRDGIDPEEIRRASLPALDMRGSRRRGMREPSSPTSIGSLPVKGRGVRRWLRRSCASSSRSTCIWWAGSTASRP